MSKFLLIVNDIYFLKRDSVNFMNYVSGGIMNISCYIFLLLFSACTSLNAAPVNFYATTAIQEQAPDAFALQPESFDFVKGIAASTLDHRNQLVKAIEDDKNLKEAIDSWESLGITEQVPHLRKIFALEIKTFGVEAPELIIGSTEIPGRAAYFDFDMENPGPGRVLLNPEVLEGMSKYASLALLIHETRHSAQFQLAFASKTTATEAIFAKGFKASFDAQKKLPVRTFCDFLTLLNEYEAFQFGNYVLGKLTNWKVDLKDMGTLASQYNSHGHLKLDLSRLVTTDPADVLSKFNNLEKSQCQELGHCE